MGGSEVTDDGIEVVDPVGLGLMRSVEWQRLILCTFCVEKKAMEGDWGNAGEPEQDRYSKPIRLWGVRG